MENRTLWQLVNSFVGREISDSPEGLWERACAYFMWCDENPIVWKTTVMSGNKAGNKVENESPHPYSIQELCVFCSITPEYLQSVRRTKDQGSAYYMVVSKMLSIVYVQNYNYGITGVFNSIFTAKVLSMSDDDKPLEAVKVEIIHTGVPALSSSEFEVLESLEKEKSLSQVNKEQKVV